MTTNSIVRLKAVISKIRTTVDGGYRVELDLPETCMVEVAKLLPYVQKTVLDISIQPQMNA